MDNPFPFADPVTDPKNGQATKTWTLFFQRLQEALNVLSVFKVIVASALTGTDQRIDSFKKTAGSAVFYLYFVRNGANVRAGMITNGWASDGTLPSEHGQRDIQDIGDTTDLIFAFSYDPGTEKVYFTSTSTNTYRFKALRVLI